MISETFVEFNPNTENISELKKIIKKQGYQVCREKIGMNWLNESILRHSFGYMILVQKAQIGRRSLKNIEDKYEMKGFVLCTMDKETKFSWIEIVCSKETSKFGKLLVEVAEEKAKSENMKLMQLYSLPEEKLKTWYKSLGYAVKEANFFGDKPKAFLMTKLLF